jgi:hypothetical protein
MLFAALNVLEGNASDVLANPWRDNWKGKAN